MGDDNQAVARVDGSADFATQVEVGGVTILVDEPPSIGGGGAGPTPYALLSSALAACTSMTLRLYARGKGWTLPEFDVAVTHSVIDTHPPQDHFDRRIVFKSPVATDRLARLIEMADHCPVHRTLTRVSEVTTSADNGPATPGAADEHYREMKRACDGEAAD
jgi:putative redox protein